MDITIKKNDTAVLKGIAILAMLVHHLYYSTDNCWLLGQLQEIGKVCVALFVLLSGYGLCVGYQRVTPPHWEKNVVSLLLRRLAKFYFNYWAIFLIWVPLGVFIFGRSLGEVYEGQNIIRAIFRDILAVQGLNSYNITWWFNKLIIILYLLSPVVYVFAKKLPIFTFLAVLVMQKTVLRGSYFLTPYLVPFVIGFIWALNVENLNRFSEKIPQWLAIIMSAVLVLGFAYLRQCEWSPWSGTLVDSFLAPAICLFVLSCKPYRLKTDVVLGFLGKHSINIYLMHTFVFGYFWKAQIYSLQNKWLIFVVVLAICLAFSVVLEFVKSKLKYNQLADKVVSVIERKEE